MSDRKAVCETAVPLTPIAQAFKNERVRRHLLASALISSAMFAPQAALSAEGVIEEIIVTATKRTENMQDVPIAIQALDNTALRELGISSFEDYALVLPNLSFKSFGTPGSATIYMRGASEGGDGNPSGSTPGVGLYLDEQPVTSIASNLDVHIYDIARIEALAGPQGTLYGASSQSGTVRIITNKPDPSGFEAGFDVSGGGTDGGEGSYSAEGFVNIPLGERAAIRLVGWTLEEGGWIDNVPGVRTYALEGGYGYNPNSFGRTATRTNAQFVEDDFNEVQKKGMRAALGIDLSDNWTANIGVLYQNTESDGLWEHDPANAGENNIQRFDEESSEDEFTQLSLTIEGQIGNHSLVYAGSFLDRQVDYITDYSKYGEDAYWVPYYACDYSATGPNIATQSASDCTSLHEFYTEDNDYERNSHELRLLSLGDGPVNYTVGVFYQQSTHDYFLKWNQPFQSPNRDVDGIRGLFFRTDQEREETQLAFFGEVTFDFTDSFSGTVGARWFDEESKVKGVVGWGAALFGVNDTRTNSSESFDDTIFKVNLTWNVSDQSLVYATWSEGYRPGGLNRDPGLVTTAGTQSWQPDILTNYEFGWKTTLKDGRLRFNGAFYFMDWEDIQYTIYQFSLSACCGNVYNLSTAEILGAEANVTYLASDSLTLSASAAYNDGETTGNFILPSGLLAVPDGTELPNVPELKANMLARYNFAIGDSNAYAQMSYTYVEGSWSEIRLTTRFKQDSYKIINLRAGFDRETWGVDVYINNLLDETADYYVQPRNYEPTTVTNRPLSWGAKYWMRF